MKNLFTNLNIYISNKQLSNFNGDGSALSGGNTFISSGYFDYIVASVAIVIALLIIPLHFKARRSAEKYKKDQLKEFKKQYPNKAHLTYQQTGMYLPPWQRAKQFAPVMSIVLMGAIALEFFIGQPIMQIS